MPRAASWFDDGGGGRGGGGAPHDEVHGQQTAIAAHAAVGGPDGLTAKQMGRSLGALYTAGSLLAMVWLALPHAPGSDDALVLAMAVLALAFGLAMLAGAADHQPRRRFHLAIALIQVVITVGYVAAADPSNDLRLFYLWATPYAVFFFSSRAAAWHTMWVAVCMTTGLVILHPDPGQGASIALVTLGTIAAVWSIVAWATRGMRRSQRELRIAATHDALTGLPNRTLFLDRCSRALAELEGPRRLFVVLIDLDRFKVVNDTSGHHTGDALLIGVAARLAGAVRTGDTVARLGGDEFAVLVEDRAGDIDPVAVAERLAAALAEPVRAHDALVYTSGGIGVATGQSSADTALALLRDADAAMYRAKGMGPGSFAVFDSAMRAGARERAVMEHHLRTAVAAGELHLAYQPIVDLGSGTPIGAEALLRWDNPELGPIEPSSFIPLAEEAGMIGEWVLEQAVRQLRRWIDDGAVHRRFRVGVNVSVAQLSHPFVDLVTSVLDAHAIPRDQLAIEITESALVDRGCPAFAAIDELHRAGVQLVVDDFGTGYSSFSYLQQMPLTALKIDRSFVVALSGSSADADIVRAIITLGGAVGLDVVAGGIETRAQLDRLRELGCPRGQGFLLGAPGTADELAACLARPARWLDDERAPGRAGDGVPATEVSGVERGGWQGGEAPATQGRRIRHSL